MSTEQDIRQHIYYYSRKISSEIGDQNKMRFDPKAQDLIAELVYKKLSSYGAELEAFAKHAKRATITVDDVKLLVRRNDSLKQVVNDKIQEMQDARPTEPPPAKKPKIIKSDSKK